MNSLVWRPSRLGRLLRVGARVGAAWYLETMEVRPLDTTESAWNRVNEGLAKMTPEERVRRAISLTILAHAFALAQIRQRYPEESERTHRLRLAARIIDPKTMRAAFDWPHD